MFNYERKIVDFENIPLLLLFCFIHSFISYIFFYNITSYLFSGANDERRMRLPAFHVNRTPFPVHFRTA